jgi:hypothetical protein
MMEREFQYDNPRDRSNTLSVSRTKDGLNIAVADEKAVDSYNSEFECDIELPLNEAIRLRDYLNRVLAGENGESADSTTRERLSG